MGTTVNGQAVRILLECILVLVQHLVIIYLNKLIEVILAGLDTLGKFKFWVTL